MRITRVWTGLPAALAVVALGTLLASDAGAAAMSTDSINSFMQYSTSGTVNSTGVTGTPVISFNSVQNGAFTAPSAFSMGSFQVAPLPTGVSTTYTNTPFSITYLANQVDGSVPSVNGTPITISGVLNGTVTGGSQSDVIATFNPASLPAFQTGNFSDTLSVLDSPISLVPSTTNGGLTTAQAQMIVQSIVPPPAAPEPTSIAVFLTAIGGLVLRRRLRGVAA
jgi:hypothetical protein